MSRKRVRGPETYKRRVSTKSGLVPVSARQAESNLALKVVRLEKLVRGLKPEVKYIDVGLSSTNVPTTGLVVHMTPVLQGTSVATRVGDAIRCLWYEINFHALFSDSILVSTNESPTFRFYVIQDLQQNPDTLPTLAQLVDSPSTPNTQLLTLESTMQGRFKILFDSKPQICSPGIQSGVGLTLLNNSISIPMRAQWNFHRKFESQIRYNGSAATDQQKGALYFVVSSNMITTGPAACFDFNGTSRVAYTDV